MNTQIAEAEAAVDELYSEMEFKTNVISTVNDQLATETLFVSRESLLKHKRRLQTECNDLMLELALAKMYLALQRGEPSLFLS